MNSQEVNADIVLSRISDGYLPRFRNPYNPVVKGKPNESWGRKATDLREIYGSGVTERIESVCFIEEALDTNYVEGFFLKRTSDLIPPIFIALESIVPITNKGISMTDAESQSTSPSMTTGKAALIYFGCVITMFVLISLTAGIQAFPGFVAALGYFVLGLLLNRVVLRGLIEWHPVYNTLDNVSSAKLGMLFLWPIRYPVLFFKLSVTKHL